MNKNINEFLYDHQKMYSDSFLKALETAKQSDKKFENILIEAIHQINSNNYKLLLDYHEWLIKNYDLIPRK